MSKQTFPPAWGVVRVAALIPPWDSTEGVWEMPDWTAATFPSQGTYHHGSTGSTAPDTLVLTLDGAPVAACDSRHISLENLYRYDCEYYQFLRLRAVLDSGAWSDTPWAVFSSGQVFFAWDKFIDLAYDRAESDPIEMSYGGGWDELEACAFCRYPFARALTAAERQQPSTLTLRAWIRFGDPTRLRALLEAWAQAPGVDLPAWMARHGGGVCGSPLSLAVAGDPPELTSILLDFGAPTDLTAVMRKTIAGQSVLLAAIKSRRWAHVPILVRHGASLHAEWNGETPLSAARAAGPAFAALLMSSR